MARDVRQTRLARGQQLGTLLVVLMACGCVAVVPQASSRGSVSSGASSVVEMPSGEMAKQDQDGCLYVSSCRECLTMAECAVDVATVTCISRVAITASSSSRDGFFEGGKVRYCKPNDEACADCREDGGHDRGICFGDDACVCVRQCEQETEPRLAQPVGEEEENGGTGIKSSSFFLALLIVMMIYVFYVHLKRAGWREPVWCRPGFLQRRKQAVPSAEAMPTLNLEGWQTHRAEMSAQQFQVTSAAGDINAESLALSIAAPDAVGSLRHSQDGGNVIGESIFSPRGTGQTARRTTHNYQEEHGAAIGCERESEWTMRPGDDHTVYVSVRSPRLSGCGPESP